MNISQSEFDRRFREEQLVLILIGMSNMGKTYWARQLVGLGFRHIDCDSLIEAKLTSILEPKGFKGIGGVAQWMGQPYFEGYRDREKLYLQMESEALNDIYQGILSLRRNTIIDTTGSFIYTPNHGDIIDKGLVVYLKESLEAREKMLERYLAEPKPVVWGEHFSKRDGESDREALERSYPRLLEFRSQKYRELADVTVPYEVARHPQLTTKEFLEEIRSRLRYIS